MQNEAVIKRNYFPLLFILPLLFFLIYYLLDVLILLALSVLLAFILDPIINFLEKNSFKRLHAILLVFLISFMFGFGIYSYLIPAILKQTNALFLKLNVETIKSQLVLLEDHMQTLFPFVTKERIAQQVEKLSAGMFENLLQQVSPFLTNIFSFLAVIIILPFTTFFILRDRAQIVKGIVSVLPNRYLEMSYSVIKKVTQQLGRYVRGWMLDALFIGLACGLSFHLIGVDNALALGALAGVGHLIPYFGPIIGGIPALLITFLQYGDLSKAPIIIISLLIIYALDNGIVQPFIFSKSVNMHPLIIIFLIIAGGQLYGVLGMLIAIPTATVIKTASMEFYFVWKNYRITRI
ncbi:MAG: AI-2E family transporter [Ignavibacteriaceae bacterium]|jgi:predicted PurR-regulated permease PerM|nr:AI-2E family transporter [Ignavibacteriaceae bacterium]